MKPVTLNHTASISSRGKKRVSPAPAIAACFAPIKGQRPWRVRLGVGSFLTFEFGPKLRVNGHEHGSWHLWIYLSDWTLNHGSREIVTSESDRRAISAAVRRLEEVEFSGIDFKPRTSRTAFSFRDFRLQVAPADYIDKPNQDDHYWLFFMPEHRVMALGPCGLEIRRSDA
jgi:hypothetical protein